MLAIDIMLYAAAARTAGRLGWASKDPFMIFAEAAMPFSLGRVLQQMEALNVLW